MKALIKLQACCLHPRSEAGAPRRDAPSPPSHAIGTCCTSEETRGFGVSARPTGDSSPLLRKDRGGRQTVSDPESLGVMFAGEAGRGGEKPPAPLWDF